MQVDRSQRSVFVGNISYEVPEETIRQIFSKVGFSNMYAEIRAGKVGHVVHIKMVHDRETGKPKGYGFIEFLDVQTAELAIRNLNGVGKVGHVVHIKMVHDRETGKPKGYGFIEFLDVQTAELAIRNLNGYEVNGRQLRVDSAAGGDRSVDEIQQLQAALSAAQVEESPYGPEPEEGRAPEVCFLRNMAPSNLVTQFLPRTTCFMLINGCHLLFAIGQTIWRSDHSVKTYVSTALFGVLTRGVIAFCEVPAVILRHDVFSERIQYQIA
ncbi:hypothetical protein COOONC_12126 [Cooperia oncophora]